MVDSTGTTTKTIVASFSRDSTGEITIGTIGVDVGPTGSMLFDLSGSNAGASHHERTVTSGATYSVFNLDISALDRLDFSDLTDLEDMIIGRRSTALAQMTERCNCSSARPSRASSCKRISSPR